MTDTALGYLLLGVAIVFVLGLIFAVVSRSRPGGGSTLTPPRGVHLPNPSLLPAVLAVGGTLIGAGLAFHPKGQLANWFVAVPGALIFIGTAVAWVRAAGHEWDEAEGSLHDDPHRH